MGDSLAARALRPSHSLELRSAQLRCWREKRVDPSRDSSMSAVLPALSGTRRFAPVPSPSGIGLVTGSECFVPDFFLPVLSMPTGSGQSHPGAETDARRCKSEWGAHTGLFGFEWSLHPAERAVVREDGPHAIGRAAFREIHFESRSSLAATIPSIRILAIVIASFEAPRRRCAPQEHRSWASRWSRSQRFARNDSFPTELPATALSRPREPRAAELPLRSEC